MNYGIIYKWTNKINGKVYIGQTSQDLKIRISQHLYYSSKINIPFYYALRKYGKDAFDVTVIDSADTLEELNKKEKYWIQVYDSYKNGYNSSEGGFTGQTNNPEAKEKWRKANIGQKRSEECKRKISESNRRRKLSQESRQKISDSLKGNHIPLDVRRKMVEGHSRRLQERFERGEITEKQLKLLQYKREWLRKKLIKK